MKDLLGNENLKPIKEPKAIPHYAGHRDRLRARFIESGADSLQDYELLELILFMAIPRRDVKPLAKALLAQFGSLPELMAASHHELTQINGMSDKAAVAIRAITATSHRAMKRELSEKPLLNSWMRLMDYCFTTMAHEKREHFRIFFLNKKNELLKDEIQGSGTVDHTPAYPREIMKRALELGATALILVHNHPSGDHKPSEADVMLTNTIIDAASTFDITVHDHIVVSRNGYTSFKNEGLM